MNGNCLLNLSIKATILSVFDLKVGKTFPTVYLYYKLNKLPSEYKFCSDSDSNPNDVGAMLPINVMYYDTVVIFRLFISCLPQISFAIYMNNAFETMMRI